MKKVPSYKVVIYERAWSQICMDCKYGEYIDSPTFNKNCCLCFVACEDNDGEYCPRKDKKK